MGKHRHKHAANLTTEALAAGSSTILPVVSTEASPVKKRKDASTAEAAPSAAPESSKKKRHKKNPPSEAGAPYDSSVATPAVASGGPVTLGAPAVTTPAAAEHEMTKAERKADRKAAKKWAKKAVKAAIQPDDRTETETGLVGDVSMISATTTGGEDDHGEEEEKKEEGARTDTVAAQLEKQRKKAERRKRRKDHKRLSMGKGRTADDDVNAAVAAPEDGEDRAAHTPMGLNKPGEGDVMMSDAEEQEQTQKQPEEDKDSMDEDEGNDSDPSSATALFKTFAEQAQAELDAQQQEQHDALVSALGAASSASLNPTGDDTAPFFDFEAVLKETAGENGPMADDEEAVLRAIQAMSSQQQHESALVSAAAIEEVRRRALQPAPTTSTSEDAVLSRSGAGTVDKKRPSEPRLAKNAPSELLFDFPANKLLKNLDQIRGQLPKLETQADNAALLSSKWLSVAQLTVLVDAIGLKYKKGPFSKAEDATLLQALENYKKAHGLGDDDLDRVVFAKGKKEREDNANFWSEITSKLDERPIIALYHHVRRLRHPLKAKGPWTPAEDAALKAAYIQHGPTWSKIQDDVGRTSSDCRDRYRNHIDHLDGRKKGAWTAEETAKLKEIVTEMQAAGENRESDVFWGVVAEKMGHERSRQQCRSKWSDNLNKATGEKVRWSKGDAYILIRKIVSLNCATEEEIEWSLLQDDHWSIWPGSILKKRFNKLKSDIDGYQNLLFPELIQKLSDKWSEAPKDVGQRTEMKKRKSAARESHSKAQVDDKDVDDDAGTEEDYAECMLDENDEPTAGPSSRPM